MALEALSSNEFLNFIIYDTISATATPFSSPCNDHPSQSTTTTTNTISSTLFLENPSQHTFSSSNYSLDNSSILSQEMPSTTTTTTTATATTSIIEKPPPPSPLMPPPTHNSLGVVQQGRKKRRRRPRVCKNKEEAESQRMTHIAVERNRRKQMNEHLAVLKSLMPESYVQRGDQASIVGGAIEFVKELEHLLQTLEVQKFLAQQQNEHIENHDPTLSPSNNKPLTSPFSQFFGYPQYTSSQFSNINKCTSKTKASSIADIEVTLIETHANVRILSRKRLAHLSKMVTCFQTLYLSILHLSVTTLDPLVFYSISAKVEEGCGLNSADEIAGAVHQMLRIIEEEEAIHLC